MSDVDYIMRFFNMFRSNVLSNYRIATMFANAKRSIVTRILEEYQQQPFEVRQKIRDEAAAKTNNFYANAATQIFKLYVAKTSPSHTIAVCKEKEEPNYSVFENIMNQLQEAIYTKIKELIKRNLPVYIKETTVTNEEGWFPEPRLNRKKKVVRDEF